MGCQNPEPRAIRMHLMGPTRDCPWGGKETEMLERAFIGEETMRDATSTMKRLHTRMPTMRDAKDWVKKVFGRGKGADAALLVTAGTLCGWLIFCLSCAFRDSTYLI